MLCNYMLCNLHALLPTCSVTYMLCNYMLCNYRLCYLHALLPTCFVTACSVTRMPYTYSCQQNKKEANMQDEKQIRTKPRAKQVTTKSFTCRPELFLRVACHTITNAMLMDIKMWSKEKQKELVCCCLKEANTRILNDCWDGILVTVKRKPGKKIGLCNNSVT